MHIQPINNNFSKPNRQTAFKSTFPVVHWVAETNGSYYPAVSLELTKKLQRKFVTLMNKATRNIKNAVPTAQERVKTYLKLCDKDYRKNPIIRSFYDITAENSTNFKPISYAITGDDVSLFESAFAKNIGKAKGNSKQILGTTRSAETKLALSEYKQKGLDFATAKSRKIYNTDGTPCSIHTKFQITRNKNGKIKDFEFIDARFLPDQGPQNPFERIKN